MKILCLFSEFQYGRPELGTGIEYAALMPALERLGHQVIHFETWHKAAHADFLELNFRLLEVVERERPEVIFAVQVHYEVWTEVLDLLRARGDTVLINWTTDDSWKYWQFSRFIAPHYHAISTTYPDKVEAYHRDDHFNVWLTQWAAAAQTLQPPLPAAECTYAVSFVGAAHGDRQERVAALAQRGIHVECFGHGWPSGPVEASAIPEIMRRSVISLNFANSMGANQIKARTFEVPGAGGFLLTDPAAGLERYYRIGEEIDVFTSLDDLGDKIRHYLAHPEERDTIARAGFERTATEHTYDARLRELLAFAFQQFGEAADRPAPRVVDSGHLARLHSRGPVIKTVRAAALAGARRIWGPDKGPRAARRLAFELSWRLAGARTYSAAGLPGRLFYEES
ncbi:CgeB family protein [Deinococcus budaensis]|uniref:Spore maturation protein CgeB n=1 Tax=Deinococcus budaensis TaxID=1665626 RepID=A0A7W8GG26_9DEIO|nr:glycosyltransferase [Deinococcus budaensis]MBB5234808.1 spore maturation protein CgeB [Deinococcus budaensis]